jgi:hypothetical protein
LAADARTNTAAVTATITNARESVVESTLGSDARRLAEHARLARTTTAAVTATSTNERGGVAGTSTTLRSDAR